jgi:hypothetical protein
METLDSTIKLLFKELSQHNVKYGLAGGILASVYRQSPRATADIDVVLMADGNQEKLAARIIENLGLKAFAIRKADLEGGPKFAIQNRSTPIYMIAGRYPGHQHGQVGIDILLPSFPWAQSAVDRAQANRLDFGFGKIPCLTVEDLLIAKLHAVGNQKTRFMDLDDIKSIFLAKHDLDLIYLGLQIQRLDLKIPDVVNEFVPKKLKQLLPKRTE